MSIVEKFAKAYEGKKSIVQKVNNKAQSDLPDNCSWNELGEVIDGIPVTEVAGTIEITQNGNYNVGNYMYADVNVEYKDFVEILENKELVEYINDDITQITIEKIFREQTNLKKVSLANATKLSSMFCWSCKNLEDLYIPKVNSFGSECLGHCPNIKNFKLRNVKEMGTAAFQETSLENIIFDKTASPGFAGNSFNKCEKLEYVIVPKEVSYMSNYDNMSNCRKLRDVFMGNTTTFSPTSSQYDFKNINPKGIKFHLKPGMSEKFSIATNWSTLVAEGKVKFTDDYYISLLDDEKLLTNNSKKLKIFLSEFLNVPEVSITSNNESIVSISNLEINELQTNFRLVEFDINSLETLGEATINVSIVGDYSQDFSFKVNVVDYVEPTYEFISEPTNSNEYKFELNANGYYESTNKGIINSFSYCTIKINNPNPDGATKMIIDFINYSLPDATYGAFSKLGIRFSKTNSALLSEMQINTRNENHKPEVQQVGYVLDGGNDFITIKYVRGYNSYNSYNNDSLQFKIRFERIDN